MSRRVSGEITYEGPGGPKSAAFQVDVPDGAYLPDILDQEIAKARATVLQSPSVELGEPV